MELEERKPAETEDESEEGGNNDPTSPLLPGLAQKTLRGPLAPFNNCLNAVEERVAKFCNDHERKLKVFACLLFGLLWIGYTVVSCLMNLKRARDLLYITCIVGFFVIYTLLKKLCGKAVWKHIFEPIQRRVVGKCWTVLNALFVVLFMAFALFWIIYDSLDEPSRLISLAGIVVFIITGFLFSRRRSRIVWRPVLWGFVLQFVSGVLMIRTTLGYNIVKWVSDIVQRSLAFSSEGSKFLFGNLTAMAFTVFPTIIYFSAVVYCIYYLGLIQCVIVKIAWIFQVTMGTTPAESFNAAANIFIGQTEASLLIRPFLKGMTDSELHAVMTCGFATVSGAMFAAYVSLGISATHLLTASVMSAPAALAMSKLMCPEIEEPKVKDVDEIRLEKPGEKNIFEALTVGATMAISLVANIAVMLIAFISLLACVDAILGWLGSMVDEPEFSFEYICSYIFMPVAYIMGVSWKDSFNVAELLGVKIFLNEFVAYQKLSSLIKSRLEKSGNTLTPRSEIVTIYALCGFCNFGSMGMALGGLCVVAPSKRVALSKLVLRAAVASIIASFMTACTAGLLHGDVGVTHHVYNKTAHLKPHGVV